MKRNATTLCVYLLIGIMVGAGAVFVLMPSGAPVTYTISTAGSTTVYPLSQEWSSMFSEGFPAFVVNVVAGGSGLGQSQVAQRLIHIGASSSYPSAQYRGDYPNVKILPIAADALAIVVSPSVNGSVFELDPDMAVAIFQGNITTWESFASTFHVTVAATGKIDVYVRSDSSGTTATFGKWLSTSSSNPNPHANFTWTLGSSEVISWPAGFNAVLGNPGVASGVKGDSKAIGYVGLAFMEGLTAADLYNYGNGQWVVPSLSATLKAIPTTLTDPGQDLMNSGTPGAYPIARLLFYLVNIDNVPWYVIVYLDWAIAQGQAYVSGVGYVPINGTAAASYSLNEVGMLKPTP
jgi:phosphate transport system substrate-binding protein